MREIYISAEYPTKKEIVLGYDGENNSANLNIKLPDCMVGEKFIYKVHFKDAFDQQTTVTPSVSNGVCTTKLTSALAVGGRLQVQVVGVSSKTPVATTYKVKVPRAAMEIRFMSGEAPVLTISKSDVKVTSIVELGGYDIWSIKAKLNDDVYPVEAKCGAEWTSTSEILSVVNEQIIKTPVLKVVIKGKDGDLV